MASNIKKIFITLFFPVCLIASENAGRKDIVHPFYLLPPYQLSLQTAANYYQEEHEYEIAKQMQDLFKFKHWSYQVNAVLGLAGKRQAGLGVMLLEDGQLSKEYTPSLNLPDQSVDYHGFHAITLFLQQHFETESDKNKLAVEIKVKGSPLRGKETNNTYSGKDVALSFLYSHQHQDWRVYGDLHAEVIGKKKTSKFNTEKEVISAYSQFGNLLGIQWLQEKYWLDLNALFYLTTDYNSISNSYSRFTDKGFVVGTKMVAGVYLSDKSYLTLEHARQGANFNVITESTTQSKEFEIEIQYTQLGVTWLF